MKILQISSASSIGGGERYLVDLTNALVARGHDLYAAVRPGSPLIDHLKISSSQIKTLPLRNALDFSSARQLARFVSEHGIDVIHAHMARDYSLSAYAAKVNPKTKFIVTRHVLFPLNRLHRRTLAGAARVIAVSEAVAHQLRSQSLLNSDRIEVVFNGIDTSVFSRSRTETKDELRRRRRLPPKGFLVGSIGELRTLKRHDDFIRAAALVAEELPSTRFVIAGVDTSSDGKLRKGLDDLVAQLGLQDKVTFPGWLEDVPGLLGALDVFVSASETESFGLSIVEAMAVGTAVVSTATEGAKEVIRDGNTGLMVPIGDYKKLAESIAELLHNQHRREEMGSAASRDVEQRFSLTQMVDAIERIYIDSL